MPEQSTHKESHAQQSPLAIRLLVLLVLIGIAMAAINVIDRHIVIKPEVATTPQSDKP